MTVSEMGRKLSRRE